MCRCDGLGRVLADAFVVSEGVFNGIVGELRVGTETVEVSGGSWWPVNKLGLEKISSATPFSTISPDFMITNL